MTISQLIIGKVRNSLRVIDWQLAGVVTLAAALRLPYIGMFHLIRDEAILMIPAFGIARHGQWTWSSWNAASSWPLLPKHSPLTVYLTAIPYLFSPDPRAPRLWVASLGVVTVGLVYWTIQRYFGQRAALIAGLLLAAQAAAVDWSRFVWNPHYAPLFIAGWILTGLLGYYEGNRRSQALHWLMLSGAIQSHPINVLMIPLSLLLLVAGWLRHKSGRATLGWATLMGWGLFLVSLLPWGIGILLESPDLFSKQGIIFTVAQVSSPWEHLELGNVIRAFADLTGSINRRLSMSEYTESGLSLPTGVAGNWFPPDWIEILFKMQAGLTGVALLFMLAKAWQVTGDKRVRLSNIPAALLALLGSWPMAGFLLPVIVVKDYYLMALVFGAVPCLGIFLAQVADLNQWLKWLVSSLVGVLIVAQSWLTIATMREHYMAGNLGRFDAPLDTFLSVIHEWNESGAGREMIILAETAENGRRIPHGHANYWRAATEGYPTRVVLLDPPQGVPIPVGGALVASTYGGKTIPALFGPGSFSGVLRSGEPMYRWIIVPSIPEGSLAIYPENFSLFANGARILRIEMDQAPKAGEEWPFRVIWKIERTDLADSYTFSIRLVNERGDRFGQVDGMGLSGELWRVGDTVINRFRMPVGAGYQNNQKLWMQVFMYKEDAIPAVDDGGGAVGRWVTMTTSGTIDQLGWFQYHPAGRYEAMAQHQYFARLASQIDLLAFDAPQTQAHPGGSLPVTLYWAAAQSPALNYHVFVHLRAADGSLWGQSDKVNPAGAPTAHWSVNRYLIDRHTVLISPDIPPGQYELFVGLWDEATGRAVATDEAGEALGDSVPLHVVVNVQP